MPNGESSMLLNCSGVPFASRGFSDTGKRNSLPLFIEMMMWPSQNDASRAVSINVLIPLLKNKLTVFLRKPQLREAGILPKGGVARFYGTAKIHRSGPVYEEVWTRLVQPEKERDPDKKGFAVLIEVERAEDLDGQPLR